jgi:hypothetical protein
MKRRRQHRLTFGGTGSLSAAAIPAFSDERRSNLRLVRAGDDTMHIPDAHVGPLFFLVVAALCLLLSGCAGQRVGCFGYSAGLDQELQCGVRIPT